METQPLIQAFNNQEPVAHPGSDTSVPAMPTPPEEALLVKYTPEKVFIVYGTLAPTRPNFKVIEHIKGQWKEGVVKGGRLVREGWGADMGYPAYKPTAPAEAETIQAFLLFSDELPDNWPMLDAFEGDGYRRILAPYQLLTGEEGVGFIYAVNQL